MSDKRGPYPQSERLEDLVKELLSLQEAAESEEEAA